MKLSSVIVTAGICALCQFQQVRAEMVDGIKAIVHDSIITYQQVLEYTAPVLERLRSQYGERPDVLQKQVAAVEEDNLEQLLQRDLILREFEVAGYTNALPETIIDEELRAYIHSSYGDDRVRFIKTLQAEGKTLEQFRKEFRDRIIVQQMRLSHETTEAIVSPHKIEVYYNEHKDSFKEETQVKLRMIVLNKPADDAGQIRKLADEILAKINDGSSFAELASEFSQGPQRAQAGDWGWVAKSVLRKELADVAFTLKTGEKSGVIETPEACYLMLVEDAKAEHIQPLNEVRDKIESILTGQERDRVQKQWIGRLKKKTFIRYF